MTESLYAIPVVMMTAAGLWTSNLAFDRGLPHYVSRKIGHFAGGLAFVLGVLLFSNAVWPMVLSGAFAAVLFVARLMRPHTFRGVGGDSRKDKMSEVWFPLAGVMVFGTAWLWLDTPYVALACLLFMAWGDGVTGIIRAAVYHRPTKGLWGSLGMLAVCVAIAVILITPAWIGLAGAATATLAEWAFGDYGLVKKTDDNWAVPLFSLVAVLGLQASLGYL